MNFAEWISAIAAVAGLIVAGVAAHSNTKLRLAISEFKNMLIVELDTRYMRKPDNDDDYPATRREVAIIEEASTREHLRLDAEIKAAHARISSIRDAKPQK